MITRRMLREAWQHLQWAMRFIRDHTPMTPMFLAAALGMPGYEQNVFIDGFIRLAADGEVGEFEEYLQLVCGSRVVSYVAKRVTAIGIAVTDLELVTGTRLDDSIHVEHFSELVKGDRIARNTLSVRRASRS